MTPRAVKNHLWLIWKDSKTRERFVVGRLTWDSQNYCFSYVQDEGKNNLTTALERGFELLSAFPELNQEYIAPVLFKTFAHRLPDRNRKDVLKLFETENIPVSCSDIEFLALTGGRLPTDTLEFVPEIVNEEKDFNIQVFVAGLKHYEFFPNMVEYEKTLLPGTELKLKVEPSNPYDSHAIEVLTLDNKKMGYIPVFYSRYLDREVAHGKCKAKMITFHKKADFNSMLEIEVSGKSAFKDLIETVN